MNTVWLEWLGQGGYLIGLENTRVAIDPYLSNELYEMKQRDPGFQRLIPPPIAPEAFSCDILIATHDHADHLDTRLIALADARIGRYLCPSSCGEKLLALGIAPEKITEFNRGCDIRLPGVSLRAVYACHTKDSIGVVAKTPEGSMYFVGDSLMDDELFNNAPNADVLFCCINGKLGNMTAPEARVLAGRVCPDAVVPCHYGMFSANTVDPMEFKRLMRDDGIPVSLMRVGGREYLQAIRG